MVALDGTYDLRFGLIRSDAIMVRIATMLAVPRRCSLRHRNARMMYCPLGTYCSACVSAEMAQDDFRTFKFEATVEQVRYWVPQIADVARVAESNGDDYWKIVIQPYTPNACSVEMTVRGNEQFDAVLGGETYPTRALASHSFLVSLLESVADGRVLQRRWKSSATGALQSIETLIMLSDGTVWTGTNASEGDAVAWERHDHHFLPYRRMP